MSHTKNMKISNCLKLVLLCGCPPDNSNFQLQLGQQEESFDEEIDKALRTELEEHISRSELSCSTSTESLHLRQILNNRCYSNNEGSNMSANNPSDVSYQDEQKAIALILEYLKIKYPPKTKNGNIQNYSPDPPPSQPKLIQSKWKENRFKKCFSLTEHIDSPNYGKLKGRTRAKSFHSVTTKPNIKSNYKMLKTVSLKSGDVPREVEITKESVKSPKLKVPLSFFKRLTSETAMQSRTIVETNDLEIKEIILSENNEVDTNIPSKDGVGNHRIERNHQTKNNHQHLSDKDTLLSPDVGVVLNPNILDEVSPYVLRFVKHYLGDFRRYLIDAFIGVDSISLDYFESMVKTIDNFPIDDLTLFKNIKYTLALLFQEKLKQSDERSRNSREETIKAKYQENLQRRQILEPSMSYKYTIKTMKPINFDSRSMGDMPAFLVRYYPRGNKLHRNQCSQTEFKSLPFK